MTNNIEERLAALEQRVKSIELKQRRQSDIQRGIKGRLDSINTAMAAMSERLTTALMALGDKFTDGLIRSSDQFSTLVDMGREQAQTSADISNAMRELEQRIYIIERWRHDITKTAPNTPAVSGVEQLGNEASMTVHSLETHFDNAELDALIIDVFGIKAEPSDFGERKRNKAREMVKRAIRRGLFWKLVNTARQLRPNGLWPLDTGPLS